jgi:hypothetical protein
MSDVDGEGVERKGFLGNFLAGRMLNEWKIVHFVRGTKMDF